MNIAPRPAITSQQQSLLSSIEFVIVWTAKIKKTIQTGTRTNQISQFKVFHIENY